MSQKDYCYRSISSTTTDLIPNRIFTMKGFRSNLPVPGSGLPTRTASPSILEDPNHPVSQISSKPQAVAPQRSIPIFKGSKPRDKRTRIGRPLPVIPSTVLPATEVLSTEPPKPCNLSSVENPTSDGPELKSSSHVVSIPTNHNPTVSDSPSVQHSQYHGPQLVEPCVGNALFHVLQPCGHRVITRDLQLCGQNCKDSDSAFANKKTRAKFACAVCIARYVREHYEAKKELFIPSLDMLEKALGGFNDGWKDKRIARMERVWKNDATEEQRALEKLGRYCEALSTDPDEEKLVDDENRAAPEVRSTMFPRIETKTGRLSIPVAKQSNFKSPLAVASPATTVDKRALEGQREETRRSRIPVGPRLPRR